MGEPEAESGTTEEEVTFEEEVDRASLAGHGPLPHHEFNLWLLVLPALCAALLLANVRRIRRRPRRAAHQGVSP